MGGRSLTEAWARQSTYKAEAKTKKNWTPGGGGVHKTGEGGKFGHQGMKHQARKLVCNLAILEGRRGEKEGKGVKKNTFIRSHPSTKSLSINREATSIKGKKGTKGKQRREKKATTQKGRGYEMTGPSMSRFQMNAMWEGRKGPRRRGVVERDRFVISDLRKTGHAPEIVGEGRKGRICLGKTRGRKGGRWQKKNQGGRRLGGKLPSFGIFVPVHGRGPSPPQSQVMEKKHASGHKKKEGELCEKDAVLGVGRDAR